MPTPLPRAILFDLDDTILDTTRSATRVWRRTAQAFEAEIGQPVEVFEPILERSRAWYWSDPQRNQRGRLDVQRSRVEVTHHGLKELGIDDHALAQRFAQHYSRLRISSMRPFDGALDTLQALVDRGVALALLTNGDARAQRRKVEHFDLARHFKAVLIEGEMGFGKPDPRVFQRALRACQASPDEAWCVGDSLAWEVAAPQALGMRGIWNDWDGVGLPPDCETTPDRIIRSIRELHPDDTDADADPRP